MTPFKTTWKYSIHVIVVFTIVIYIPEKEICALFPLDLFSYPGNFFCILFVHLCSKNKHLFRYQAGC